MKQYSISQKPIVVVNTGSSVTLVGSNEAFLDGLFDLLDFTEKLVLIMRMDTERNRAGMPAAAHVFILEDGSQVTLGCS